MMVLCVSEGKRWTSTLCSRVCIHRLCVFELLVFGAVCILSFSQVASHGLKGYSLKAGRITV